MSAAHLYSYHIMDCSKVEEVSDAMDSVSLANDEENADSSKQARTSKAQKRRVINYWFT